jgi:hypothetical protein
LIHDHVDHCLDTAANGTGKFTVAVVDEFKAISNICDERPSFALAHVGKSLLRKIG